MKLYIKNMVCQRCILAVKDVLTELKLTVKAVTLGEVELASAPESAQLIKFSDKLKTYGFELISDKKQRIIEKIKNLIITLLQQTETPNIKLSDYLSGQLHYEYNHLSHLFSSVTGTTIEQYHITQRIEKVKELLVYDELSLSEIAHRYGFSSVAHLSSQFKKVTGLTPSHFKHLKDNRQRIPLDKI